MPHWYLLVLWKFGVLPIHPHVLHIQPVALRPLSVWSIFDNRPVGAVYRLRYGYISGKQWCHIVYGVCCRDLRDDNRCIHIDKLRGVHRRPVFDCHWQHGVHRLRDGHIRCNYRSVGLY